MSIAKNAGRWQDRGIMHACYSAAAMLVIASALPLSAQPLPSEFQIHPELKIELFAMEPDVVDPVSLCFDAAGRMYVVEMRDYPYGIAPDQQPGGTVRLLEDRDRNGRVDRSSVFADKLSFPTSIAPYRDGVIVAAPPEIVYLKDTDNDGRADVREVLYRGFDLGVTDSNMSGLRWGSDNWLHGVNGGNGGTVSSTRNPGVTLRLGDLDFRLDPDRGQIETTYSTGGGFGLVFDDWGRSFTPHNINHMQMRIMTSKALDRHPGMPPVNGTESISDHGEMARIYPISEARTRPNHPEQAGHFSASGGMGHLGNSDWPGGLHGSVLVCDVVGNLVHRDLMRPDGPIFTAGRAPGEEQREFIASTDPLFRPVGLEPGPDGAYYLLDMHRDVIEHPDYIPEKMLEAMDIRAGETQGRIYRVLPKLPSLKTPDRLPAEMNAEELVQLLASPIQWNRTTAQRLLVERGETEIASSLEEMVRTHENPLARMHALWTLAGLNALLESTVIVALEDEHPGVVENAIKAATLLAEGSSPVRERVAQLARHGSNARIRFMALQHREGSYPGPVGDAVRHALEEDGRWKWSRIAALSALVDGESRLLNNLLSDSDFAEQPHAEPVLRQLAELTGARLTQANASQLPVLLATIGNGTLEEPIQQAVLEGLQTGLNRGSTPLKPEPAWPNAFNAIASKASPALQRAVWSLERTLGLPVSDSQKQAVRKAMNIAGDENRPIPERLGAIQLLSLGETEDVLPVLIQCLSGGEHVAIQQAALEVLKAPTDAAIANGLLDHWRSLHPTLKREAVQLLLRKRAYHAPLLTAIEEGRLNIGELNLDLEDRRRLLRWSTPDIHERARKFLGDGEYGNRQAKVEEWLERLPEEGDPDRGKEIFTIACAQCHRAGVQGYDVGPDLSGLSHRSVEDLISNILDPNMAINPNYFSVAVETRDGELLTGILSAETRDAITLLQAQGLSITLNRDQIERMVSTGTSLMPEGLEAGLTPQQLRDLVAFLQNPAR